MIGGKIGMKRGIQTIQCNSCDYQWSADTTDIQTTQTTAEGNKLELQYFTCKECGKVYPTAVYSGRAKLLQQHYIAACNRYQKAHRKGEATQKQLDRVHSCYHILSEEMRQLMNRYAGEFDRIDTSVK